MTERTPPCLRRPAAGVVASLVAAAALAGCGGGGSAAPDRTPLASRTASITVSPTRPAATRTAERPTSSPTPTEEPRPTASDEPTEAPTEEATATKTSKPKPTEEPVAPATTAAKTKSPKPAKSKTASPTPTPSPTTPSPSPTPAAASTSSDDSTPWGWIILVALVVAGIITGILLFARRRRWAAWRQGIRPAVDAAHVSRDMLPAHGRDITDVARWESVRAGAEHAAADLESAATRAPGGDAAAAARSTAQALTGVTFALEAARLMQATQPPPTAGQLAEADATAQARKAELDAALARLDLVVGPPEQAAGPATA